MDTIKMPTVRELFKEAIDFTKINYKALIKINLFYLAVIFAILASTVIVFLVTSIIFENAVSEFISILWVSLGFISVYLFIFQLYIGIFKGNLRGLSDDLNDYYLKIKSATWTSLLYMVTIRGAFLALFIPGIILSLPFKFLPFVFFEKNFSGIKTLSHSYDLTKNRWWNVFSLVLKVGLVGSFAVIGVVFILFFVTMLSSFISPELAVLLGAISGIIFVVLCFYFSFLMMRINYKIYGWLEQTKKYTATEEDFKTRKTIFILLFIIGLIAFAFSELKQDKKDGKYDMHRKDRAGYDGAYMMNKKFMDMKMDFKGDKELK